MALECLVEFRKIFFCGFSGEMVDYVSFTARACPFNKLAMPSQEHRAHCPVSLWRNPVKPSVRSDLAGKIDICPVAAVGCDCEQRKRAGIAYLFEGILLQAVVGGNRIGKTRDVFLQPQ